MLPAAAAAAAAEEPAPLHHPLSCYLLLASAPAVQELAQWLAPADPDPAAAVVPVTAPPESVAVAVAAVAALVSAPLVYDVAALLLAVVAAAQPSVPRLWSALAAINIQRGRLILPMPLPLPQRYGRFLLAVAFQEMICHVAAG